MTMTRAERNDSGKRNDSLLCREELGGGETRCYCVLSDTKYRVLYIGCSPESNEQENGGVNVERGIWTHLESWEVRKSLLREAEVEGKTRN